MFGIGFRLNESSRFSRRFFVFSLAFWFVALVVSVVNPYDLFPVSDSTYLLLLLNVFSFFIGYSSIKTVKDMPDNYIDFEPILVSRIFKVVLYFCLVVSIHMLVTQFTIIAMYNVGVIRQSFYEVMFEGQPGWMAFAYTFVLRPFFFFVIPLLLYCIDNRSHYFDLICMMIFTFAFSFISGGRTRFIFIVIIALFYFMARYKMKKKNILSRSNKGMVVFILGAVIAATIMSSLRAGEKEVDKDGLSKGWEKNITQLVTYNTGSFVALEDFLNSPYMDNVGGPFFFRSTFGGVEEFFSKIIGKLTGIEPEHINKRTIYYMQDKEIQISNNIDFNFAYTNVIFHYLDLGVLGVFLYPFLFGLFVKKTVNKINKTNSPYLFCLLAFMFCTIYYSLFSLLLVLPFAIPYSVLLLFLDNYNNKKSKVAINAI